MTPSANNDRRWILLYLKLSHAFQNEGTQDEGWYLYIIIKLNWDSLHDATENQS
jgi:hypothetical protein